MSPLPILPSATHENKRNLDENENGRFASLSGLLEEKDFPRYPLMELVVRKDFSHSILYHSNDAKILSITNTTL